jgi:hypothetical protein
MCIEICVYVYCDLCVYVFCTSIHMHMYIHTYIFSIHGHMQLQLQATATVQTYICTCIYTYIFSIHGHQQLQRRDRPGPPVCCHVHKHTYAHVYIHTYSASMVISNCKGVTGQGLKYAVMALGGRGLEKVKFDNNGRVQVQLLYAYVHMWVYI